MHRQPPHFRRERGGRAVRQPRQPQFQPQNPNYVIFTNQNPDYVNFPIQSPNWNYQVPVHHHYQQRLPQNTHTRPHNESLQRVEWAVKKARRELLAAGESVSAWKVSQAVLLTLQVNSWESLGFAMQQVPSLLSLIVIEAKVNAFIHCFVAVRRICSLYDMELALCKTEGVEQFKELELGPLVRHPLVMHYFSPTSDVTEALKITTEEIISCLNEFSSGLPVKKVKADAFLEYVAKKHSVTGMEKLNVRIQDLGRHVAQLKQTRNSENIVLKKYLKGLKNDSGRKIKIRPLLSSQKKQMDHCFGTKADSEKPFSSTNTDSRGKHVRSVSSSSEDEDDVGEDSDDDCEDNQDENEERSQSTKDAKLSNYVTSCPSPSAIQEHTLRGLNSEVSVGSCTAKSSNRDTSNSEPAKRKRESENICCAISLPHRLVHQDEADNGLSVGSDCMKKRARFDSGSRENSMSIPQQPKKGKTKNKKWIFSDNSAAKGLWLPDDSMDLFITTWKEACRDKNVDEVFDRMLQFYRCVRKNKVMALFSSYPFVGLLNVAVTSIKRGMWDSMYDALLTSRDVFVDIKGQQGGQDLPVSTEKALSPEHGFTLDDVIKKVTAYMEGGSDTICKRSLPEEKIINFLKKLCRCESWLIEQFCVEEFETLGFGDFPTFLERHMHLLPLMLQRCLTGNTDEKLRLEACMQQCQLDAFLSQASSSLWGNESISKQKIFDLLRKQFPLTCFKIVENDPVVDYKNLIGNSIKTYSCVLFSATLLKRSCAGGLASQNENSGPEIVDKGQDIGPLGIFTANEAIEVLLRAPMLTDLALWSHWDLIFAPSLGPLVEWLLNDVNVKELLFLVTTGGEVIRIDHSATMDSFLEVLIRGSSFETAVQLLSLFALYGGEQNVPKSLLKCHIQRAFEVFIKNFTELEMDDNQNILGHGKPMSVQHFFTEGSSTNQSTELCGNSISVNKVVSVVARFILDCLSYLPLEFCSFAADVMLAALQSFVRNAPTAILVECKQIKQRLMLHQVGLSTGVVEWVNDYKNFCSLEDANALISSKSSSMSSSVEIKTGSKFVSCASNEHPTEGMSLISKEADRDDNNCKASGTVSEVYNHTVADGPGWHSSTLDKYSDPIRVIETIRLEEFGLDPSLSGTERTMLEKQHARLGRALHCLSHELYSQDSHFLLELVQNADDNVYPEVVEPMLAFILQEDGIIVLNNELGFSVENIRALCDVGNSTKKAQNAGYIGKKGIGFKSVFRITNAPEIHSNGFHIKFDITDGQIGFVLPTAIPPCDIGSYSRLVSNANQMAQNWNTCIVLPFSANLSGSLALNNTVSMFSDLQPSILLFLHRLKCITFRNMLSDSFIIMKKEVVGDGIVKVFLGEERMTWLVVSQELQADVIRPGVQTTEISVAFTLQETDVEEYIPQLNQQPVFAFLPLRNYGLKFILQGDFVLPSSREEVDGDSEWNQWLLSEFPGLFVGAERSFCNLGCFRKCPGKAISAFMSFVPLPGEVHGFFSSLPWMIISKLRISNCLLLDGDKNEWVPPCKVIRNWSEQARALLPDHLLSEHLTLGFLNKDIVLSDSLARALGVEEYGPKTLLQILCSLCCSENGLRSIGLGWLSAWLSEFYVMTLNTGTDSDLIPTLRKLPFIPLCDGKYGSVDEGIIWMHSDAVSSVVNNEYGSDAFPKLYSQLRTVSPALFSAVNFDVSCRGTSIAENVRRMLLRVGVQQLSAHDIMKVHILPAISDANCSTPGDKDLRTEYLAFSMFHLYSGCPNCSLERECIIAELRTKAIILTNHGYKRPFEVPIHFGKDFGNPIEINKLINGTDMLWHEVDITYLKHPVTKSLSDGVLKWRTFLQELGVSDFVQIIQVEKRIADMPHDIRKYLAMDGSLISMDPVIKDWESEELYHLLSQLSSTGVHEKCRYLLEMLDMLWDDCFCSKVTSCCNITSTGERKLFCSSFISMLNKFQWIVSSTDDELHYPRDLFHDCEAVRSILGATAPYVVPKVRSEKLLKDIGLKTEVGLSDMLSVLKVWRQLETPFKASISQMSNFYNLLWSQMSTSKEKVMEELLSGPFIFVPYEYGTSHENVVPGELLSHNEVHWLDSTGSMDHMKVVHPKSAEVATHHSMGKTLCHVYPTLHDFFVIECGVNEIPPVRSFLQVLLQLASVALPSQAAKTVFQIFQKWTVGLKSGSLGFEDLDYLKEALVQKEFSVLPTAQDKWVSLNSFYGHTYWSDNAKLRKEFEQHDNIGFLYFGALTNEENEIINAEFPVLMQRLGIPALSQVVTRESVFYGPTDSSFKASLVNWALPYAQRYVCSVHPDKYFQLKQAGFDNLKKLQIIVVEKLFYKNVITEFEISSRTRHECDSLLQGNILYTSRESDSHSIFLELSRLFFDEPELHMANFLHMIVTMLESGSTEEQTEFFILNSQKVPKIPVGELVWSLSPISITTGNDEMLDTGCVSSGRGETEHLKSKRRCVNSSWPPANWRTATGIHFARPSGLHTQATSNLQVGKWDNVDENNAQTDMYDPKISVDVIMESDQVTSTSVAILEDSKTKEIRSQFGGSETITDVDGMFNTVDFITASAGLKSFSANSSERAELSFGTVGGQQASLTGKMGEYVAYQYFVGRGETLVQWVNEATETGFPYDIIVGNDESSREYIEVKSTKYARKGWFTISAREWQFAVEKGECFSIARVVLSGNDMARVTVYKNPVKLCQQGRLELAVVIPNQQQ